MAYWFWLLRRGDETIVVDCGFAPEVGARRGRTCLQSAAGRPASARRRARVGLDGARDPPPLRPHRQPRGVPGGDADRPAERAGLLVRPDGPALPVRLARRGERDRVRRGGGRRGSRAADRRNRGDRRRRDRDRSRRPFARSADHGRRGASDGDVVLASDAVHFYEELEFDRPFSVVGDLAEMYAAYDVLKELARAGAKVVPGHDPEVARRYPRVQAAGDGRGGSNRMRGAGEMTSGIIGLGNMGGRIARRIRDEGLPVLGYDLDAEQAEMAGIELADLGRRARGARPMSCSSRCPTARPSSRSCSATTDCSRTRARARWSWISAPRRRARA